MNNLPKAPEFTTKSGHAEHKVGDLVRLRDPLPETADEWGVVVVIRGDWFVVWHSGECQSFDEISGDELSVFSSIHSNDVERFNACLDDGVTRVSDLLSEGKEND
tara:strand:- start:2443 stop:2757 length:315 start_codon:yes stop_codon:yes gene_type:complete